MKHNINIEFEDIDKLKDFYFLVLTISNILHNEILAYYTGKESDKDE